MIFIDITLKGFYKLNMSQSQDPKFVLTEEVKELLGPFASASIGFDHRVTGQAVDLRRYFNNTLPAKFYKHLGLNPANMGGENNFRAKTPNTGKVHRLGFVFPAVAVQYRNGPVSIMRQGTFDKISKSKKDLKVVGEGETLVFMTQKFGEAYPVEADETYSFHVGSVKETEETPHLVVVSAPSLIK